MCIVQFNYLDEHYQAGIEGIRYAADKGMAVVVMEPLLGGRLANPPQPLADVFSAAPHKRTFAEWGLQWVWNHPEVSVVLSGMSTIQQVEENLAYAERSTPNKLTAEELALYQQVREAFATLSPIPCTECRYCMPCHNNVFIPYNFQIFNRAVATSNWEGERFRYKMWDQTEMAGTCSGCRSCEDKCPQSIAVADWMPIIDAVLGKGQTYDPASAPKR
jgi:predicted aldo/keto reductase-like oxidoreductase